MNRLYPALRRPRGTIPTGVKLVSILSGKGGVGKSVIAYNLAERAAAAEHRTLLVDADLCCGNLHILANVDPMDGLIRFVSERSALEASVTRFDAHLDILARSDSGPIESLQDVSETAAFVDRLRRDARGYDLVILDHGSGISNNSALLASASDCNLIVMIPELTSISDGFGLCKFLYQTNQIVDCRIVLNRVESSHEAEYLWNRFAAMCEQFLGWVPVLAGRLPEDPAVRRAVAAQAAISDLSPDAPVIQALTDCIETLTATWSSWDSRSTDSGINSLTATAEIRE